MGTSQRDWLDVPFSDKDAAKGLGARWDPAAKRWFAPRPGMTGLARWAALPELPDLLPGEDRTFGSGLFVDLVPAGCWFTNVRSATIPRDWERLRRMINRRAGQRCEACGRGEDRATRRWLEAHERWAYDPHTSVQALRRLICLCSDCHQATHLGLAQVRGLDGESFDHLMAVTGMSAEDADTHVQRAFAVWEARCRRDWSLDLSILTAAGITLAPPPDAPQRYSIAAATLAAQPDPAQPAGKIPDTGLPQRNNPAAVSRPASGGGWIRRWLLRG